MKKFAAIEGLRAWLAWAVVADHLAWWSDFHGRIGNLLRDLGYPAVLVFVIVSGFVITHLIVANREPYRVYITRRFFRLFPLFAVSCIAGYFAYKLQLQLLDFDPVFMDAMRRIVEETDAHFWSHVIAHASMLYGAIPGSLLPSSDVAFNMPAWSISLEWQFYLIAPLIVMALIRKPKLAPVLAALFAIAQVLVARHWGHGQPAFLLLTSGYFAIGIGCRLLYPVLNGRIEHQSILLTCVIVLAGLTQQAALAIWGVVYIGLITQPSQLYRHALENPIVIYLGSRSYSTYLGHFVVVILAQHIGALWLGHVPSFPVLALMVVPMTLVSSELLYRTIEVPGIQLGSKLCKKLQPAKAAVFLRAA